MNLYLIRHSIAEKSSFNKKDIERELTEEGRSLIKNFAHSWKNFVENFDIILSSPLKRTVQTSEIISSVMQTSPNILLENNLAPGSRTSDLIDLLTLTDKDNIAVVGHQPDLSIHISNFCGKNGFSLVFPAGAIAKIEFERQVRYNSGKLIFLIPPSVKL
jgi:phosphohistidine phosphatase